MAQNISEIYDKLIPLVGVEHLLPITANKGLPGILLEDLLGIPHTSNCLDCIDGELKIFPIKKIKKTDTLVPKESIAITMLCKEELIKNDFKASRCYKKMSRMLIVPYYRSEATIRYLQPTVIDKENTLYSELYNTFEADYNKIREHYIEHGVLNSSIGYLLQNRTKGSKGSTSRAFYLRPAFMKKFISLSL